MQIQFDFKNFHPSESLKEYARNRFEKLNKYVKREDSASLAVLLEVDRYRQIADVKLSADDVQVTAKHESEDMYATIDQVLEKLRSQLKKSKDKQKDRQKGKIGTQQSARSVAAASEAAFAPSGGTGRMLREPIEDEKPKDPEEALIQLQAGDSDFLVFVNAENDRVNVIYSKGNGDYGLIDPGM